VLTGLAATEISKRLFGEAEVFQNTAGMPLIALNTPLV